MVERPAVPIYNPGTCRHLGRFALGHVPDRRGQGALIHYPRCHLRDGNPLLTRLFPMFQLRTILPS
jgi:hypothetical protein